MASEVEPEPEGTIVEIPEDYDKPRPPQWRKREVFDVNSMRKVDERARKVRLVQGMTFEDLASKLTDGLKNDLQRVRAVFVWMGSLHYMNIPSSDSQDIQTPVGFVKLINSGKRSHAEMFAQICRTAGLKCVMVRGNCKSAGYEIGEQDVSRLRVKWNAVLVDGSWQIVHPQWSFTCVGGHTTGRWTKIEAEGKGTREKPTASIGVTLKLLKEDYFLPHPEEFIYKCIAEKKEWQLLKQPWDIYKFVNAPQIQMDYFKSDFKISSPSRAVLYSVDGKCEVEFTKRAGSSSSLTYQLFFNEEKSKEKLPSGLDLPRSVFMETDGEKVRLLIRFHVIGIYKLSIFSMKKLLVEFKLEANEKSFNENMLPICPQIGFGFGHAAKNLGILEPSHTSGVVVTKGNKVETFTFNMATKTDVVAKLRHIKTGSETLGKFVEKVIKGNRVAINVTMPENSRRDEYVLQVYKDNEKDDNNVLNYVLTNRKKDFESLTEKQDVRRRIHEVRVRRSLDTAISVKRMVSIKKAILAFEDANLKDTTGSYKKAKILLNRLTKQAQSQSDVKQVKQRLRQAMKRRDAEALEDAIEKAEELHHRDLDDILPLAKELLLEIEQQQVDEDNDYTLRTEMREAGDSGGIEELEETIAAFQSHNLPDNGDLTKAKTALLRLYEHAVQDIQGEDLDSLQHLLEEAKRSVIARELQDSRILQRANSVLLQRKRLDGQWCSAILDITSATIAEIHSYPESHPAVHDVMRASLVIMGKRPKDVDTWKKVQKHLVPAVNVLRWMKNTEKRELHRNTVKWATQMLAPYTIDDAREASAGVAAFYEWSKAMIED